LRTLIFIEIGFSRDLGCDKKHTEKVEKYSSFVAALQLHRGRVGFVAIPIGLTGTTLAKTLDHLIVAFSADRPRADQARDFTAHHGLQREEPRLPLV
jgi:hypothetical protein